MGGIMAGQGLVRYAADLSMPPVRPGTTAMHMYTVKA
jgi:hypothetical protein